MPDKIRQYYTILDNIWMFLTLSQLRAKNSYVHNIGQYLAILGNLGQYETILDNTRQYWMVSFKANSYLSVCIKHFQEMFAKFDQYYTIFNNIGPNWAIYVNIVEDWIIYDFIIHHTTSHLSIQSRSYYLQTFVWHRQTPTYGHVRVLERAFAR